MPSQEELKLMQRMDGGTGNAEQDAHIARHLQRIVDVPEAEIQTFLKSRNRHTVHKLRTVLKDLPRGPDMTIRSQPALGAGSISREEMQRRMAYVSNRGRTSYRNVYGHDDREPAIKTLPHAFGGIIRSGFQPHLEQWQLTAGEDKVQALAETCRSLRNWSAGGGPPTTYKFLHCAFPNAEFRPPPEKENKQNKSAVPLGNIYAMSKAERQAEAVMKAAKQAQLDQAMKTEEDCRRGKEDRSKVNFQLTFDMAPPDPSCAECLGAGGHHTSKAWKSEGKSHFLASFHSRASRIKMGVKPFPRAGEREWREFRKIAGPGVKCTQSMPELL
mmetsp:Transcript_119025/g.205916  ORF Transcript_119025/g.205916 Transcript_119025/m.205916 type:complete len:329 (+) Transcript_119025:105-1091(+)